MGAITLHDPASGHQRSNFQLPAISFGFLRLSLRAGGVRHAHPGHARPNGARSRTSIPTVDAGGRKRR